MNFQTSKRIMCCLMAALILCCAVVRPLEASAASAGAVATGATVVGISPGLAVAGILVCLGVGYAGTGDFEDLVENIVENIPADFIIETSAPVEMVEGAIYQDVCYVSQEFVSWVNDWLYAPTNGSEPALYADGYELSTSYQDIFDKAVSENPEYSSYADDFVYSYCYQTGDTKHIVYTDEPLKYINSADGNSRVSGSGRYLHIWSSGSSVDSSYRSDLTAGWTFSSTGSTVSDFGLASSTSVSEGSYSLSLSDSLSTVFDGQTYIEWFANALSTAETTTAVLPIPLDETIEGIGIIIQSIAQAGTKAPAITYEKTDTTLDIVVSNPSADLSGIITLLQAILEVLNNIYNACAVSVRSWIESSSAAIADAIADFKAYFGDKIYDLYLQINSIHAVSTNIYNLVASGITNISATISSSTETMAQNIIAAQNAQTEALINSTTATIEAISSIATKVSTIAAAVVQGIPSVISTVRTAIVDGTTAITTTITDVIAQIIENLLSLGLTLSDILAAIQSLAITIADAIAAALTAIFVPSADFVTTKVEALRARFDWINPFISFAQSLSFDGVEPPVIYVDLGAAEGSIEWGGKVAFLDMTWYSRYKATGDAIISGFLWMLFGWRMYLKLPGIISGAGGTVGHITRYGG